MPSRLAASGVTQGAVTAVRSFTGSDGHVYAPGATVPWSALVDVPHLNALWGKHLLLHPSSTSRVQQAEIDSIEADDVKVTQPFFQPHSITGSELRALVAAEASNIGLGGSGSGVSGGNGAGNQGN